MFAVCVPACLENFHPVLEETVLEETSVLSTDNSESVHLPLLNFLLQSSQNDRVLLSRVKGAQRDLHSRNTGV